MNLPGHMALHLSLLDLVPVVVLLGLRGRVSTLRVPPLPAGVVATLLLVVWHLPRVFDAALERPALHALEHVSFLVAGLLLWAPVLVPRAGAAEALAFLFLTRNAQAVLGNVLLWVPRPLYANSGTLHDQRLAAALMLGEGLVAGMAAAAFLFVRLLRESAAGGAWDRRLNTTG